MNQKLELRELKKQAGKILGSNRCWVCKSSDKVDRNWTKRGRSGFTVHHLEYTEGEKIHSDFDKGLKGRIEYYNYLMPIIKKNTRNTTEKKQ